MYVFLSGNLFENKTNQPNKKNALNLIKRSPSVTSMPRFPLRKTAANLTSFTPSKGAFVSPPPSAEDEQDNAEVQSSYRPVQHPAASKPLCKPLGSLPRLSSQDRIFPLRSPQVFASRPHAAHGAFFFPEASANEAAAFVIQRDNDRVQFSQQQILPGETASDLP